MSEQRISTRARVLAIPALGAVAVGVAAFGRGSFAQDAMGTPTASPSASPAASPTANQLAVTAHDIYFDPKTLQGPADTEFTIVVTNEGAAQHDFNIDELNVHSKMLNPGESEELKVKGAAGDYQYYCSVPGHKEAGMVGTLTLAAQAASGGDTAAAAGGGALAVTAADIYFDPKQLSGAANTDVQITVTNNGAAQHDFNIDALNVHTKMLNPGESETVTANGAAGDYQYYCSVPGHKEAGMVGTLTLS